MLMNVQRWTKTVPNLIDWISVDVFRVRFLQRKVLSEKNKYFTDSFFKGEIPAETLFLTKPHLFGHNASWTNVDFQPDEQKHESTILFEPTTGSPIRAQLRIQLNVRTHIDRLKMLDNGETQ